MAGGGAAKAGKR